MKSNYEDQATRLRNQMEQIQQEATKVHEEPVPDKLIEDQNSDVDILNLPPRSHVHDDKEKKTKWKFSFLFVRFLLILFLIIVVLILTYHKWGEELLQSAENNSAYSHPAGERVSIVPLNIHYSDEVTIQVEVDEIPMALTGRYYTVSEGDTLHSIAKDYYQSTAVLTYLRKINKLESNLLQDKQRIFLPNKEAN